MRTRSFTILLAAVLAIVLAGCGGSQSGVSGDSSASLITDNALAFASVDTDLHSDQWQTVDDLLNKFPGREQVIAFLRSALGDQDLRYDRDIDPALGPEVDLVVAMNGGQVAFAVLTQPDDLDKLKALVAKLNEDGAEPVVYRKVGDWYAISQSDQSLDGVLAPDGGGTLDKDAEFTEAMGELPDEALFKAYVNLKGIVPVAKAYLQKQGEGFPQDLYGLDQVNWFSAALQAKDNGVRLEGAVKGAGVEKLTGKGNYISALARSVPSDALAFLTFRGGLTLDTVRALRASLGVRLQRELGVSDGDLVALFQNEVAFYVRPSVPLPEFSLALETPNEQDASAAADKLMAAVARQIDGKITTATQDGVTVKTLVVPDVPFRVNYAVFDGKTVATTSESGIRDFRAAGDKLPSNGSYQGARAAADVPEATSGLLYANLRDIIAEIERYATASGEKIPPGVDENLQPLRSVVGYSVVEGDVARFAAFLEIK
jgi:Protein of unknown function (DUF3352)